MGWWKQNGAIRDYMGQERANTFASPETKEIVMQAHRNLAMCPALALFVMLAASASGEGAKISAQRAPMLKLVPAEIRFNSTEGTATVSVMLGDAAVKSKDIKSAAMVDKAWMFKVTKPEKDPGTVTVSTLPEKVEDGSYRLAVKGGGQTAYADVYVTLTPTASTSALTFLPPRLELDDGYQQGTTLTYKLEAAIDLDYVWTVNGKTILQGPGETKLVYTFAESGPCTIGVTVKQGDKTLGHSEGTTQITPERRPR